MRRRSRCTTHPRGCSPSRSASSRAIDCAACMRRSSNRRSRCAPTTRWPRPHRTPAAAVAARSRRRAAGGGGVAASLVVLNRGSSASGIELIGPNSVAAVDPSSGRLTAQYPVGSTPTSVATDGSAIWVLNADDGTISRIDDRQRRRSRAALGTPRGPRVWRRCALDRVCRPADGRANRRAWRGSIRCAADVDELPLRNRDGRRTAPCRSRRRSPSTRRLPSADPSRRPDAEDHGAQQSRRGFDRGRRWAVWVVRHGSRSVAARSEYASRARRSRSLAGRPVPARVR